MHPFSMTPVNHHHGASVDPDRPLKVGAQVTDHVTPFPCSKFFIIEHGHGCIHHDEP